MSKDPTGWWDPKRRCWLGRFGDTSPTTGKRKPVELFDENGDRIAQRDRRAARKAALRMAEELAESTSYASAMTVTELAKEFLAWHAENGTAQGTIDTYYYHLNRFAKFDDDGVVLGGLPAAAITPQHLWKLKKAGIGALRNMYASVMACWRWAARPIEGRQPSRLLAKDPLQGVQKPKAGRRKVQPVAWKDARRYVRLAWGWARSKSGTRAKRTKFGRRLRVLCLDLIASVGCRPFEAWGLRWDEIHWDQEMIVIDPTRAKTRGKDRRFNPPTRLLQALRIVQQMEGSHPVFVFVPAWAKFKTAPNTKEYIRWVREDLKPAIQARGEFPSDLTLYWFRHEWQSFGIEVETAEGVSAAAGNSPKVLLSTYVTHRNRRIKEVTEKVAKARRQKRK